MLINYGIKVHHVHVHLGALYIPNILVQAIKPFCWLKVCVRVYIHLCVYNYVKEGVCVGVWKEGSTFLAKYKY